MKITSGGQSGVDRAALDIALELGVVCGGWCPAGRLAEDGAIPTVYPLIETPSGDYRQRTEWNVRDSDLTLLIYWSQLQGGSLYTFECAQKLEKPILRVDLEQPISATEIIRQIRSLKVGVLNVAGPRESFRSGSVYSEARLVLHKVISSLQVFECLRPIGFVRCSRREAKDDFWDQESSSIELCSDIMTDSLLGLDSFSHVEIVFLFDQVPGQKIEWGARHPRNNRDWPKVGVFAQRGKNRPNRMGTTVCRIKKIEAKHLFVEGLDAVDGTPVLDIKPWIKEFGPRGEISQPSWVSELMKRYWE